MEKNNKKVTSIKILQYLIIGIFIVLGLLKIYDWAFAKNGQDNKPVIEETLTLEASIKHDEEFGGIYITSTIEEFNSLGFEYGDSVNVYFSNGYTLEDIPYYNGYYTKTLDPLLVAYKGYPFIKVAFNNGPCSWEEAEVQEGDTAKITLNKKG